MASSGIELTSRHVITDPTPVNAPQSSDPEVDDEAAAPVQLPPVARREQASVLLSAFLTICLTIGYNQTYGVFQEYYLSSTQTLLNPPPSSLPNPPTAELAFVGTLGAGLTWAGSIFVNPLISRIEHSHYNHSHLSDPSSRSLFHRLGVKHVTILGVALMCCGFLLASFAMTVTQLLLTQGLLYGIGSSLLYFPLLGPAPEYFTKHRATALGLILSGGGVGGLVLSPALRSLLSTLGAAWTLRVLAGLSLVVGLPVALAVPPSRFPTSQTGTTVARRRTHIQRSLLSQPAFLLSAVAAFTQAAGAQLPLTFIPSYSVSLGFSAGTGATLLATANVVNAVARVITGYAGDRFGRLNALVVSLLGAVAAVFGLWLGSVSEGSNGGRLWLAFVVLYSVSAGGYYALFPATIADVFGIRSYAAVNGFIYFIRGCGTMVGSPVGGTLLGKDSGGSGQYANVVYWDGALLLGSAVCILGVRWADAVRRGWMWRA
ncbi:monocarboxylate transporter [Diplogelasinospora grovesii]|uniref:Monocarboxylate transporter n=1 Tax=Diplogelasinospora grovesii TaxID=303347 RepID=A0AAN6N9A6_9PEZI|nr:monocarboxylate transporter [Diplogelasinospora grovesii]